MPDQPAAPPTGDSTRSARPRWALPFVLGLIGALVGILGYVVVADPNDSGTQASSTSTTRPTATTRADAVSVGVYQKILPSLVYVEARTSGDDGAQGSGVIVNEQGQILTALHVVRDATAIRVTFTDGTRSAAEIVGADPDHDIAVLESEVGPEVIVPAVLGGGIRIGDEAFPVGSPLGFVSSITAGVVSGLDRTIARQDGGGELTGLIQFDAAVNPGSSGGPLLDRDGQVVGIVTALANPTERNTFIGIGFAVPIATASGAAGGPER
jgi:S1-C subfamily serine protease